MGKVLLYDIGGRIPNLALMKLSAYYKAQGCETQLCREPTYVKADRYYAGVVFYNPKSAKAVTELRRIYGSDIAMGGSGVDVGSSLPPDVDRCFPDYHLYPSCNYAVGFLTRGCNGCCPFCLVPEKEGRLQDHYADFADFVPPRQQNIMLLDNNLLASGRASLLLEEMVRRDYKVNFSQTLDIRFLNNETLDLLKRVKSVNSRFTLPMYYFSCNSPRQARLFYEKQDLLRAFGRAQVTVITMFGYDQTLSEEYAVLTMLKTLNLIPFLQKYAPLPNRPARVPETYFDMDIDTIAAIRFRRNGQNNEKFLSHVIDAYYQRFGEHYLPLLKARYRYNSKHMIKKYLDAPAPITETSAY